MNKPNDPIDSRILVDAVAEAKDMGRDGMAHPSTKPVLTGAGIGAVIGWLLPLGGFGVAAGLLGGAGFMLYKRVRP
jgi:hypothetical protein